VAGIGSLLTRNPDFRRLFAAELVVFGADWFVMVPLLDLLRRVTGLGFWGAAVMAVDTGVLALALPYAGTFADRLDRRKIMVGANLVSVAGVLALLGVRGVAAAPVALLAVGAVSVAKAFYSPAAQAALPNLVDPADLPAANAIAGSAWGTMAVVGASLGGAVATVVGPYPSFLIAAACLALAAVFTLRVRRPFQSFVRVDGPARPFTAIREALRHIAHRPRVLALVTVKSAVGLGNGVLAVFPILAGHFHVGALGTGLLFAARGVGAVTGPLAMRPVIGRRSRLLVLLPLSMAVYGLSYIGVAASHWFALTLALVVLAHFAGGGNWVMSNLALQEEVPDGLRGRVFSTDLMLAMVSVSASQLLAGLFVDRVEPRLVIAAGGTVTLVYSVVWALATARLRKRTALPSG